MKKALRIGYHRYCTEDVFLEHLAYVKKNLAVIDEITLFAEFSHYGYWSLEYSANNAEILKDRIKRYREVGVKRVGINLLATIGHGNEAWSVLPKADLQYLTFESGVETRGLLCFSNDEYLDYIAKRYALYAATGADFIWMDDDIRSQYGCFCPKCIQRFNELHHTDYSREALVSLIKKDEAQMALWKDFVDSAIQKLLKTVEQAVHTENPAVEIGYMSIQPNAKTHWISASKATKGRPGGGYYDDRSPVELFRKAFDVQQQIANYPDDIGDIQYEYEAFNYQSLNRSIRFSELESTLALMSGCNGVLYNNDIFCDRQKLTDMLSASARKWDILARTNCRCKPAGVYCLTPGTAKQMNEIGIPVTAWPENAVAAVVLGEEWNAQTDEEIRQLLNKNVFTDGRGLEILTERGFSDNCGGKIKTIYDNGMAEHFGTHILNDSYQNHYRDTFMNFEYYIGNTGCAYDFAPSDKAEAISNLETITHKPCGCSLYVIAKEDGSRFGADGYLFPNSICTDAKKEQLGNVIDWLSENKLPLKTPSDLKIIPNVMGNAKGDLTLMLTNASLDSTGMFQCKVRTDKPLYILHSDGSLQPAEQTITDGEAVVTIPNISPWDYILLTNHTEMQAVGG